ncbi:MAG: hypothetical protein E6J91_10225 [Deltaproteobacteria bacterium]|nr:MAG: hypothetical protein E6J91_10225 [Deltaproteobacteria bacterium]
MAPEQWTGEPLTDRVDSWALGLVTEVLLTGKHPLGDTAETRHAAVRSPALAPALEIERRDVPAAVVDLIRRSLDQPLQRPSAAEWARVLDSAIDGRGDAVAEDGPYRGLAAFDEKHARFYFGRELEIDAFVERLREVPQLPIVGPSGTGKSSFLHAGVIPRLRAREPWTVIALRPGGDPAGALARHVLAAISDDRVDRPTETQLKARIQAFRADLLETPTLLAARLVTIAGMRGSRVLLAVDQLEEAFTQGAAEVDCERFLQMLLSAVDDPLDPVRVVVTVRDDFVGKLAGLRSLFVVRKLGVDDLRRTITGPLARYDYEFDDPAIVDDLLAEVGSAEVADLPLLQFACRTLWDGRDTARRRLLRATYREMGGLAGALARHADHALAELSPGEHRIARQLLLQLVVGTTRRTVARDPLLAAVGAGGGAVLDRLLAARLLVQRNLAGEAPVIEIVHESLVQTWSQLARWLDESREERHLVEDWQEAARVWERRGKRIEDAWPEKELTTGRHRAAQLDLVLPARVQEFFAAGDRKHEVARRRRRIRLGIAAAAALAVAVPAFLMIARYLAREQLIDNNTGTADLAIIPFDQVGVPAGLSAARRLSVALYGARSDDLDQPGEPLPADLARVFDPQDIGILRLQRLRAPGGTLFLRIAGRGETPRSCGPSWLRIQAFPGYHTDDVKLITVWVPTCEATFRDTATVEAGAFVYGGPGEPRSGMYGDNDYTEQEQIRELDAFAIDRREVSNAAYEPFARLEKTTGYRRPIYPPPTGKYVHQADPRYPVTNVNAFEAQAFCAYMGKRLPSEAQWVKAARGGTQVGGQPNPAPGRLYPWGTTWRRACVNLDGTEDGFDWIAPVDSLACGQSPYGVLNLVGNVYEWIARDGQSDRDNPLWALRGGAADSPVEREQTTTIYRNHRDPRVGYYTFGLRCVVDLSP